MLAPRLVRKREGVSRDGGSQRLILWPPPSPAENWARGLELLVALLISRG